MKKIILALVFTGCYFSLNAMQSNQNQKTPLQMLPIPDDLLEQVQTDLNKKNKYTIYSCLLKIANTPKPRN